jgi:PAS domain S-box-containing protein
VTLIGKNGPFKILLIGVSTEMIQRLQAALLDQIVELADQADHSDQADVVILDVTSPRLEELQRQFATIPVVILASLENEALAFQAVQAGAQDYLLKETLNNAHLRHTLHLAIERQRSLAEHTFALQAASARLSGIVEIADDAVITVDQHQKITMFNQGAEKIFQYAASEVLGQPLDLLLPERFAMHHRQHVENFHEKARRMGERREIFGRRKDGSEFPSEASISRLDIKNEVLFTVILRDITERRLIEQMKDEFISVVSHELRTPLTSIHGALGLLATGSLGTLSAKAQRMTDIAISNTDRLVRLINDLLDIERMESGKMLLACQVVDLANLAKQAIDVMMNMAEQAGVQLILDCESVQGFVDPDRIVQMLTNLLSNAIKFSAAGARVWLSIARQGEQALLQVKDEGCGIPDAKLEMIFERFQQVSASDSRRRGGTGLGLAICRSIIQQHGGRIWAESSLGKGSTFFVTLSIASPSLMELQPRVANQSHSEPWAKILLVEDDTELAQVLMAIFERHGVGILHAQSGSEALQICQSFHPDLLVLDLFLPNMNGFEIVNRLRQNDMLRSAPLVVYSVQELNEEGREGLRLGPTRFFTKSRISPSEFEVQVLDLLHKIVEV